MPHYAIAEERRANELRTVDRVCLMRMVGAVLGSIAIAATLKAHGHSYGGLVWVALLLNLALWPPMAWWHARRSVTPLRTERRQWVLEGLFAGFWIAATGLSPVPGTVLACVLLAGRVASGAWRILAGTLLMLVIGLVSGWLMLGRPWWPDLSEAGMRICLFCLFTHIFALSYMLRTQLQQLQARNELLQRQNRTDAGIELPNRRYFESRLVQAHGRFRLYRQVASLLLIDVDHFKEINDRYGHQTGDRILGGVADILRATVRSGDLPARYGGDEFAVLLINANRLAGQYAAERIRRMMAAYIQQDGAVKACTLSIGIAEINTGHVRVQDWVSAADAALYQAKAAGRDRIVVG